jgi:membrane protease YdiL (CAAX protease family)
VREVCLVAAGSFAAVAVLSYLPFLVPWLGQFSSVLIAAAFIYLPVFALGRRKESLADAGIRFYLPPLGIRRLAVLMLVVFSLFSAGFFAYNALLFDRKPQLRTDRLYAWGDGLYPADVPAGSENLFIRKTDQDQLEIHNPSSTDRTVELKWAPPGMKARKTLGASGTSRPIRQGTTTIRSGELVRLTSVEGPAFVKISGQGSVQEGAGSVSTLPYTATKTLWWPLSFLWVHLLLVALPEELFYRGYLQTRLSRVFRSRWTVLGGDVGPSVLLTSAVFALGHLVAIPSPTRLAVFFPSLLFGWLRSKTGSVLPSIILHAASNLLLAVLQRFVD